MPLWPSMKLQDLDIPRASTCFPHHHFKIETVGILVWNRGSCDVFPVVNASRQHAPSPFHFGSIFLLLVESLQTDFTFWNLHLRDKVGKGSGSNANSETKENPWPQQAEMDKMISRSLELLTLTWILTPFLTTKAPRSKEDRDPDTWIPYTTELG